MITFSQEWKIAFICKANIGRSQIAEYLYNAVYPSQSVSFAGCEARKEQYAWVALSPLSKFLYKNYGVDISKNRIKYIRDWGSIPVKKVYFLYNPHKHTECDQDCKREDKTPYEWVQWLNIPFEIIDIPDPFETGEVGYEQIYQTIQSLITNITF